MGADWCQNGSRMRKWCRMTLGAQISYLKVGVVVVGVFGFPDLHGHNRLLHELTRSQGQTVQHAPTAAFYDFLQDLCQDKRGQST